MNTRWRDIDNFEAWLRADKYRQGHRFSMGSTRTVYGFGDFVVKRDGGREGNSNRIENAVWQRLKDTVWAKDLMPVLAHIEFEGLSFLVMRRATKSAEGYYDETDATFDRVASLGIYDLADFNCGFYRNRIRVLDYACVEADLKKTELLHGIR